MLPTTRYNTTINTIVHLSTVVLASLGFLTKCLHASPHLSAEIEGVHIIQSTVEGEAPKNQSIIFQFCTVDSRASPMNSYFLGLVIHRTGWHPIFPTLVDPNLNPFHN